MSTLQFALFFAAILVAYGLLHLRLVKFEAYLKHLIGLKQLNDRLDGVVGAMERIKVERVEEGLGQLHEDAVGLADRLASMERSLDGLGRSQAGSENAAAASGDVSPGQRVCANVEERLFQLGYQKLRILTDVSNLRFEEDVEIQVECERRMMPCKGTVTARNGAILDVSIRSVVKMFP